MKIYGRQSVNGDFPCAKLENVKKIRQIFLGGDYEKTRNFIDKHVLTYLCAKFGD